MSRVVARWVLVALPLTVALAVAGAAPARAHERRTVGAFQFAVGWGDEPSYTGFKNSVQVTITEAGGGAVVTDLGDSLKVEVSKGAEKASLPLVANFRVGAFGTPGDYRAWLDPTRAGAYTFRFTGSIRGQNVDESFSSSKTTFNDVDDVAGIQFPAKDPSTGELGTRIDREGARRETGLRDAQGRADSAQTLAWVGVGVGAVSLLAGVAALVLAGRGRGRRSGRPVESAVSELARPTA